jgi:type II secretory pathway pseudopilin PulG
MKRPMANARTSSSESGFAIIEVIVSAAVLAIVALAVLAGIDGATGSSAREKARAVAAGLAEQDQERLRAMSVTTLKAVPQVAPVKVDGVTYTIKSEAVFVTDDTGGTPACGNSSNNSEYFHITSTVTSNVVGVRVPAVKIDSLVSPSVKYSQEHGTIGAKIVDRTGNGLSGIDVSGTGASPLTTKTTDQDGCVIWRSVDVGSYTIKVNVSGYCDENGATDLSRQQTVSPNTVAFVNFTYDRCASATVNVRTHAPGEEFSTTSTKASKAREITDVSSNGTLKTWTPTPSPSDTFTPSNLFPYPSSSYGFFTGECQYQSPEKQLGLSNYFTNTNSGASMTANPAPAANAATVFQPPVNMRLARSAVRGPVAAGRVDVYMTPIKPAEFATDTCADQVFKMSVMDWPSTGWGTVPANNTGWVSQDKNTFDPGLPFGTYSICLWDTISGEGYRYTSETGTQYDNTSVNGRSLLDLSISGGDWTTEDTCS